MLSISTICGYNITDSLLTQQKRQTRFPDNPIRQLHLSTKTGHEKRLSERCFLFIHEKHGNGNRCAFAYAAAEIPGDAAAEDLAAVFLAGLQQLCPVKNPARTPFRLACGAAM